MFRFDLWKKLGVLDWILIGLFDALVFYLGYAYASSK